MQPDATKADPVQDELKKILASSGFVRNERLCGFLRFIVERKLQDKMTDLKETVIGTEVFSRKPDYDTHSDPVVRTEASKLRARLAEYYAGPGADDPVRIEIPKGAYIPRWDIRARRRNPHSWFPATALAALALVAAGFAVARWTRPIQKNSIAVLPFLNLSSDPDNAYFSDGLTDQITGLLSLSDGLEVIARTSSFALKGVQLDARQIGSRLNATVFVEGSVQRSGERLKVIVQLIRAADGRQLWSNIYERPIRDVFATEEEIAASIVNALRLRLGVRRRYTDSVEAFDLYLRGRHAFDQLRRRAAMEYFEKAVATDASYAPAYAGIADAALWMSAPVADIARATAAVERAFELDPKLAEAYTALGEIRIRQYAWKEAERAFRRAIELNPSDARAHLSMAYFVLAPLGRLEEAVQEARLAQSLDPLSSETNDEALMTMLMGGLYGEAEAGAHRAVALDPYRFWPHGLLARSLSFQGKHAEAMEAIHRDEQLGDDDWKLACVAVRAGRRDEARHRLEQNLQPARPTPAPNRRLFMIYACLGDKGRALEYAEKAYGERDPLLPGFLRYPETAWLRTEPTFVKLGRQIGLPE